MKSLDEIRRIKAEAEEDLLKLPGVEGVDVGYKYVGDEKKDELVIRVYVSEKKDEEDLLDEEIIPKTIQGVPTDVLDLEGGWVLHPGQTDMPEEIPTLSERHLHETPEQTDENTSTDK
jgi:hypothetical protein